MDAAGQAQATGPALVGANWYRFRAHELIRHQHVDSVCFVWAVRGKGDIVSFNETFSLESGSLLRLPWHHDVEYRPDTVSPFHLGTIHLVPRHDLRVPIEARVAYAPGDPLLGVDWRRGPELRERPLILTRRSAASRNLVTLGTYGAERILAGRIDEAGLRSLGQLIADESDDWTGSARAAKGVTIALTLMTDFILANLDGQLSVGEVALAGGCSTTTAERLFVRHTGTSVAAWWRQRRMQEAALLLRTSGLRVSEVARKVGYSDPLHFSRVFTATFNLPPSRFAAGHLRP